MAEFRVIQRVEPFEHETISSFLMRTAEENGYRRAQDILSYALGSKGTNPAVLVEQVERLADYTRTTIPEISQLSGISKRFPQIRLAWQINGEWISKFSFLSLKQTRICPQCLSESPYLRGDWSLILNTACWRHGIQLHALCPRCGKTLENSRYFPARCICGFDLCRSPQIAAEPEETLIAKLIAARTRSSLCLDSNCLVAHQIENLARLSLDGLCQSLWFLGHDLYCQFPLGTGRGHPKLSREEALRVIKGALWMLSDWPDRLRTTLVRIAHRSDACNAPRAIARNLGPLQRYYEQRIQPGDTRFIGHPYETYMRDIATGLGRKMLSPLVDSPQLVFQFD